MRETDAGLRRLATDFGDDVLELLPVLAALDGLEVGADQLDAVAVQDAVLVQGDGGVQRGLSAEGGQHGVDRLPRAACWAITFSTKAGVIGST